MKTFEDTRECGEQGFSTVTATGTARYRIQEALNLLDKPTPWETEAMRFSLRQALADLVSIDVDGECPFLGDVTVEVEGGIETWECPLCRTMHEKDIL